MQSAYALLLAEDENLDIHEGYLTESINKLYDLYFFQYRLLLAIHQKAVSYHKASKNKYIETNLAVEKSVNFTKNRALIKLKETLSSEDYTAKKFLDWKDFPEIVNLVWSKIITDEAFVTYMELPETNFQQDKKILLRLYKDSIAPDDNLYEFYESQVISWAGDIPFVNTWIYQNLKKLEDTKKFVPDPLYRDIEDRQFVKQLFRKVVLNFSKYEKVIDDKTPNWDSERITKIDKLLIVMGITEFLHFPSIPTKVTINEYIEIAKDYATPKSGLFINGVLDKLLDEYKAKNAIKKTGRGLL